MRFISFIKYEKHYRIHTKMVEIFTVTIYLYYNDLVCVSASCINSITYFNPLFNPKMIRPV